MPRERPHVRLVVALLLLVAATSGVLLTGAGSVEDAAPGAPDSPGLVVGLGDSVTSGAANDGPDYVTLYATTTGPQAARAVNLGQAGLTADGLDQMLTSDARMRSEVAAADTVLVTIGANDLQDLINVWSEHGCDSTCQRPVIQEMGEHLDGVLRQVDALRKSTSRVGVTTYWNVFGDGAVARDNLGQDYLRWSDEVTRAANATICREATANDATCIDLYTPLKGSDGTQDPTAYLAADGDHPNRRGVALIVAAVRTALAGRS